MKKLITILTIMIVLVGSAFAIDNAVINVSAVIPPLEPAYVLSTVSGAASQTAAAGEEEDAAMTPGNIEALTAASGTVEVTFEIKQNNKSRTTNGYTLNITATPLYLLSYTDNEGEHVVYASVAAAKAADDAGTLLASRKFTVVNASPVISAGSNAAPASYATNHVKGENAQAPNQNKLVVSYDGVLVDGQTAAKQIGTFGVSWNANATAEAGTYKSAVTLIVTAN